MAAAVGAAAVAGAPDGRGRRAGQPLDPLGAVLAVAGHDDDGPLPARPRGRTTTPSSRGTTSLDPAIPTVGSVLGAAGYRSSYIGKWHLTGGPTPPMDLYGYADWDGNDQHFMGWAGTGVHFDPVIADSAARWLDANGGQADPWFLTVALVNPHDVMWFPMDQPDVPGRPPRRAGRHRGAARRGEVEGRRRRCRRSPTTTTTSSTSCPANFDDDLLTKPACHRQWRWDQQHWLAGYIDPADRESWRRQLDYYVQLHQLADESLGHGARRARAQRRVGRHGRRVHVRPRRHVRLARPALEGPVRLRRDHAGALLREARRRHRARRRARAATSLSSHVDLARTICGVRRRRARPGLPGRRPRPARRRPAGHGARPRAVRARHRAHVEHPGHPLGDPRHLRRPPQVRPLLRRRRRPARTTTSPACPRRCSTAPTPRSRTRSTSGTTSRRTRTSWSTWRWTTAGARAARPLRGPHGHRGQGADRVSVDAYEGSQRQRRQRRRTRIVAVVLAVALLLPIIVGTAAALTR